VDKQSFVGSKIMLPAGTSELSAHSNRTSGIPAHLPAYPLLSCHTRNCNASSRTGWVLTIHIAFSYVLGLGSIDVQTSGIHASASYWTRLIAILEHRPCKTEYKTSNVLNSVLHSFAEPNASHEPLRPLNSPQPPTTLHHEVLRFRLHRPRCGRQLCRCH
jgi:hypothetical protein